MNLSDLEELLDVEEDQEELDVEQPGMGSGDCCSKASTRGEYKFALVLEENEVDFDSKANEDRLEEEEL